MKMYDIAFFCHEEDGGVPKVEYSLSLGCLYLTQGEGIASSPVIKLFMNERQSIEFKNRVVWAWEAYQRKKRVSEKLKGGEGDDD